MVLLIQIVCWVLFGYIGFKMAEKFNDENNMNFDPRIWASIGFLFGVIGLVCLVCYGYFKINKKGD